MGEEGNVELAFVDFLLKQNNGEISLWVYRNPTHTDQYLHYSSHHQTSCKESVVSSLFNRAYSITTNKDELHKGLLKTPQTLIFFWPPFYKIWNWRLSVPAEKGGWYYV